MHKMFSAMICAAALAGCRTPITPDQSWADYSRYYSPTGETAAAPEGPATVRVVRSRDANATVDSLKAQGYVLLGSFKIEDGTDVSRNAVAALAQKLNASEVVWCSVNKIVANKALPNPDMGIVGVDKVQMAKMNANRPDQTFSEQVTEVHHTVWMLGKKAR